MPKRSVLSGQCRLFDLGQLFKDTQDILFLSFLRLAVGMGAGVGMHLIAVTGTLFICLVILLLTKLNYAALGKREFLLRF